MTVASLERYSSLVREVDGECAFVRISGQFLVSGTRSGEVACWDISSGEEMWRRRFSGPCANSDCNEEIIFFTETDHIHAVEISSGEIIWSVKLEGSSDFVQISGELVWVTTSFYNFEIQDYSEGAVWQIDYRGKIRGRWATIGRSWSLTALESRAIIGLSRPRCGYAVVSEQNGIEYLELEEECPVTVGMNGGDGLVILGHSNGTVTEIIDGKFASFNSGESTVRSIDYRNGWVAGLESGRVTASRFFGSWSIELSGEVDIVCFGPSLDFDDGVWISSWKGESNISLVDSSEGTVKMEISHGSRIVSAYSIGETICFGDSSGCVYVIEGEVLRRRFALPMEEIGEKDEISELRRKIRGLRGG